jgi:cbb3-type cytochrome oxidase cytochrome c subunit
MNSGFRTLVAVFIALGASWCGFVLAPDLQLGAATQTTVLNSSAIYPLQRTGDTTLGLQVYRACGCAACHTEQVRQDGVDCEVVLADAGKKPQAVEQACTEAGMTSEYRSWPPSSLPITILRGVTKEVADAASGKIAAAGGKAEIRIHATGVDIARGWGVRRSVAADFLCDSPVQLGSLRAGPDLANIGVRKPDLNWQLVHLYAPQSLANGSAMPPFRFLFELRKVDGTPSPDSLQFPENFGPPAGYAVFPKPEAKLLAAYLLSLRADVPLYEAPFSPQ